MAETKTNGHTLARDFSLVHWDGGVADSKVRRTFQNKWDWVVSSRSSNAAWYLVVISNLLRTCATPGEASVVSLRNMIVHGLHRDAFNRLKAVINTSGEQLSQVVGIPARTIARRSVFKPDESERILRVASAFQKSIEVLGSLEKARRWFASPKRALGSQTPFEFCNTELGAMEVMNLLGRIEHGVFS